MVARHIFAYHECSFFGGPVERGDSLLPICGPPGQVSIRVSGGGVLEETAGVFPASEGVGIWMVGEAGQTRGAPRKRHRADTIAAAPSQPCQF